jgi:CheY-like chemotaxis protein
MKKILVVDDDDFTLDSIKMSLEAKGYTVLMAYNGKEALEIFQSEPVPVVITDLQMPVMDGVELVNHLIAFENKPIIIIQSTSSDIHIIIELMQKGVYDYLLKPYIFSELVVKTIKAFEIAELRLLKENSEKERELRIAHLVNWNEWKEGILKRDQDKIDSNLIGSIRTSFSQGSGLGSLLSVISRIQKKAKEKEDCFEIGKPLMQLLFENAQNAMRVIKVLEEIDTIHSSELSCDSYSLSQVHSMLASVVDKWKEYELIQNHKLVLCENTFEHYKKNARINSIYFEKAISELLLNAFKFSKPDSKIYIIIETKPHSIFLSILNSPEPDESGMVGILPEYSNIIFEPFFRISKLVFEKFPTLDFGLGLTMVDKVVRKHKGKIKVTNLLSHLGTNTSDNRPATVVNFEIELPVEGG